jgi:hypothetical protein
MILNAENMKFKRLICVWLTFYDQAVSLLIARLNIQKFYMVLALRCVFCTYLRTDSDLCFTQH